MKTKIKAAYVCVVTFLFTALLTTFKEFDPGYVNGIWFIWFCFSWNYFAYAFDRGMLPSAFSELSGNGKGDFSNRTFFFWGTFVVYLSFLALMAFPDA